MPAGKVKSIKYTFQPTELVDITVENDPTFWMTENGDDWLLSHNTSWPDIDSDAGDRDELINAARELYGDEAVLPVSNFNTFKLKSLIKEIAKYHEVDFTEVNKLTGPLEREVMPFAKDENTEKSVFVLKHEDCMKYSKAYQNFMEKHPSVKTHLETLFMQNSSIGRHAGGVIIAQPNKLAESMPIVKAKGELQTPWTEGMNFRNLEDNGFIKFDFLGLTLMKDVENCIRRVLRKEHGKEPTFLEIKAYFDENINCRYNEQDDQKVWKNAYHKSKFAPGLFQMTADGARKFCNNAKPTTITELAAITAIYRPGPLKAKADKALVEAKKQAKLGNSVRYEHPIIEKILSPTHGTLAFQEQFMRLAQELAGFSPGESDKLRKTLVKKSLDTLGKKGDEREQARQQFVKGSKELNGVSEHVSNKLWDRIAAFSIYGFNKSVHYETQILSSTLDSIKIQDIKPDDIILSRDEETRDIIEVPVKELHDHGKQPVFEFTLETGEKIKCTMQHKFRTHCGKMAPMWLILQDELDMVVDNVPERIKIKDAA